MSAEVVPIAIQTLVVPYAQKHRIPVDHTLFEYLKVTYSPTTPTNDLSCVLVGGQVFLPQTPQNLSDSPWEAKAVAIIQSIGQLEVHL